MAAFHLIIYGRFWVITEEGGWCPNFVVSIPSAAKAAQKHGVYGTAKAMPFQSKGKLVYGTAKAVPFQSKGKLGHYYSGTYPGANHDSITIDNASASWAHAACADSELFRAVV